MCNTRRIVMTANEVAMAEGEEMLQKILFMIMLIWRYVL